MKTKIALLALPALLLACSSGPKEAPAEEAAQAAMEEARPTPTNEAGQIEIEANDKGFRPDRIYVEAGAPVKLLITRTLERTCMDGFVIPSLDIEEPLEVGVPVEVEFTPEEAGTIAFQCPMGHGKSAIVVLPGS